MVTLHCNYCNPPHPFPNFRKLLTHYWEYHATNVKRYQVIKLDKSLRALVYATTESEAAYVAGCDISDCNVLEVS